jgi:hypothetical protein
VAVPACASLVRTSVNQAPGNGTDYPFTHQDDSLGWVILDAYLSYTDDACAFVFPFYISLYPTAALPALAFTARVTDELDAVVFSGVVDALVAWDTDRYVAEIFVGEAVLRLVLHAPCFNALPLNAWTNAIYPLDARTYVRMPKRVRAIRIGLSEYQEAIDVVAGYNIELEQRAVTNTDGKRLRSQIFLDGVAGAGIGRLPGCDPENQPLRLINKIGPDEFGNFNIDFSDCYRAQRNATVNYGAETPTAVFASDTNRHGFKVFNDCKPCQDCSYFVRTYRGLKVLWDRFATIATSAENVRDQLATNIDRWNAAADCRSEQSLQVIFTAEPECRFFAGAMYCNNSACCVTQPELRFTFFRYVNGVPVAVAENSAILRSFVQIENNDEQEILPTDAWPVYVYKPDLVSAQSTFMARLRFCTVCSSTESYGVYVTAHFNDSAYTTDGCEAVEVMVPAALTAVWTAKGLTTPTMRALTFKLVPANPNKEPFGCECN